MLFTINFGLKDVIFYISCACITVYCRLRIKNYLHGARFVLYCILCNHLSLPEKFEITYQLFVA